MWYWRRLEKIRCVDQVRNEEVLQRAKEEENILHAIKRRKTNWVGYILCGNCLLKDVIEEIIERTEVAGRRGKDVSSYWMTLRKGEDMPTGN